MEGYGVEVGKLRERRWNVARKGTVAKAQIVKDVRLPSSGGNFLLKLFELRFRKVKSENATDLCRYGAR